MLVVFSFFVCGGWKGDEKLKLLTLVASAPDPDKTDSLDLLVTPASSTIMKDYKLLP